MKCKYLYLNLIGLFLLSVLSMRSYAEVPHEINYQGYLTNSSGNPIDGTLTIQFSLYDNETAETQLWSESQSVIVNNGIYNVRLGSQTSLNLAFDQQYYLGIKVESDPEMTPRQPLTSCPYALGNLVATVLTPCSCVDDASHIQQAVDNLPLTGGTIHLKAGTYLLNQGIHIHKSNVTLLGERGTILQLDDHVSQPVILIGTDIETPTTNDTIQQIRLAHLEIDGNMANQDSEIDPNRNWIRNNGIDIRTVDELWIENVDVHDARSGGIVASWLSHRIVISNSSFHHNFFDGIALYDSEDILVSNFLCYNNDSAGLSLDNKLKHVTFHGGHIKNNGDVGIFVRDSEDTNFHNLMVFGNASHGAFLSHNTPGSNTGVTRLFFQGCSFLNNAGKGFVLASTSSDSPNNVVIGSLFSQNIGGDIQDDTGVLSQAANIFQ